MSPADYEILCQMSNNGKPPDYAVKLLEDICARTGLEWKARHVYLMQRGGKWGVTLSIDGFRAVGARDPEYAGQEGPFWVTSATGTWTDIPPDGPIYAAKVGVKNKAGITTWGVAKFKDYAAGAMWTKFPSTMSAKCAEMLAWRKAFPGHFGGLYGQEEMDQAGKTKKDLEESGEIPTEKVVDFTKNKYVLAFNKAESLDAVIAVGKEVSKDKGLSLAATMELHKIYQERKKKYEHI
jgi:hypothetical protein